MKIYPSVGPDEFFRDRIVFRFDEGEDWQENFTSPVLDRLGPLWDKSWVPNKVPDHNDGSYSHLYIYNYRGRYSVAKHGGKFCSFDEPWTIEYDVTHKVEWNRCSYSLSSIYGATHTHQVDRIMVTQESREKGGEIVSTTEL